MRTDRGHMFYWNIMNLVPPITLLNMGPKNKLFDPPAANYEQPLQAVGNLSLDSWTAVIIVTHGRAGADMVEAAESVLRYPIPKLATVSVIAEENSQQIDKKINFALQILGITSHQNVLFLIDLIGSTPARLCWNKCSSQGHIVTGVNMPMLLKLATVNRQQGPAALGLELAATGTKSIHCE